MPDRSWNSELLKDILNDHPVIYRIVGIPLPVSDVGDSCRRGVTNYGDFSTKSATWLALGCRQNEVAIWPYS